ncbi:hypothetical protein L9F63_011225 [Diploptera punctata]|uniref:Uncharacterized protein n=1 Tax=Diploptera punctata TaxID=6984 RepID=A0AAD8AHL3_DIPPU|nr:hypothetical protein L9F63_011225 [Diploptera punctata]
MEALCIAQELWKSIQVINVVIVISSEIYTYFPYNSLKYCGDIKEVNLIDIWDNDNGRNFVYEENLFPDKIPKHFHGCPINVSVGNNSTEEHNIGESVFKSLNLKVTYLSADPDVTDRFERIRMAMQYLVFGNSEIAMGGIPLVVDITMFADHLFPYFDLQYKWFVPCGKLQSRIDTPLRIFSTSVYIALVVIILLLNIILKLLSKYSEERPSGIFTLLYNIWAISLGVSIEKFPCSYKLRILLFSWICFSFALNVIFQTFFTSYIVDPGVEKQISTLEELLESGIRFGYRQVEDRFYKDSSFRVHKEISRKRENCERSDCIQEIVDTGKFATFGEVQAVENYIDDNDVSNLVCVMNDLDTFTIKPVAFGRKGSIILSALDRMFMLYIESGICNKKYNERNMKHKKVRQEEFLVFQIKHLVTAFCALLTGCFMGLMVLICEIINYRYVCRNQIVK